MRLWLVALLMLSACSPRQQVYMDAPTGDVHLDNGYFYTADDAALPYRSWLPPKKPRAVIVALHGFNDYSNAFEGTGDFFSGQGIAVYAYDQRGFGKSPQTGIWGGEQNFVNDLSVFVREVEKRHPRTPVYILGESMGGAVALAALSDPEFPAIKGLVLVAPAVWGAEAMSPFYRGTLWLAAHSLPFYTLTGEGLKIQASNNIPMLRRLSLDPLVIKATRIDTVYGLVGLMGNAYDKVGEVNVPVLLLYGAQDQVIPPEPVKSAMGHFAQPVRFGYYPDGYHMLLRDLQGREVMKDILHWIDHPKAQLPSGFAEHFPQVAE